MSVFPHLDYFAGLPVEDFDAARGIANPTGVVYRIRTAKWRGEDFLPRLEAFLNDPHVGQVPALVIGCWSYEGEGPEKVTTRLGQARDALPNLRSLFLGDIVGDEREISWIQQADVAPLLHFFPLLEELWVRGGNHLRLAPTAHANLRALAFESGGLPAEAIEGALACDFPALEHLEFWIGEPDYGGDSTLATFAPLLAGGLFPRLLSLALRDCPYADELAGAVARSRLVRRLKVLDLSEGNLGDVGAQALLDHLPLSTGLQKLDIHHHYVSEETVARLRQLPFAVDARDPREADEDDGEPYRYIAHAE